MVLLRHLLGDALRRLRLRQGRTLREVSASARVSLGYLSEVERGQKEASSELLASICSALSTPLSQVLREVSDNFALAELQSEPVFTGMIEPPVEVTKLGHGPAENGERGEREPVADVASDDIERRDGDRVPAGAGRRVPAGSRQLSSGQLTAGQLSSSRVAAGRIGGDPVGAGPLRTPGQLRTGQRITVPGGMPISSGLAVAGQPFDEVSRSVRDFTTMVPV